MPEISVESISTAGVLVAFLFAAAAGVTSRRGIRWLVLGVVFSCLSFITEVGNRWIAGQRGGYERNGVQRVRGTDRGPQVIGDVSAERVGQLWRAEDHEALLRTMRAADELTLALIAIARRESREAGVNNKERTDDHGVRSTTEPVGVDVSAGGD
jgi:hypothetical protein